MLDIITDITKYIIHYTAFNLLLVNGYGGWLTVRVASSSEHNFTFDLFFILKYYCSAWTKKKK